MRLNVLFSKGIFYKQLVKDILHPPYQMLTIDGLSEQLKFLYLDVDPYIINVAMNEEQLVSSGAHNK